MLVARDSLVSHPVGSSNTPCSCMLVTCDRLVSSRGSYNTPSYFMLVTCDKLVSHPGGVTILVVPSCWVTCDRLVSHSRGRSFMLQKPG